MPYRTFDDLKTGARQLADMEDDNDFIASDELGRYVNEGIADLYDARVDANPSLFALNGPTLEDNGEHAWLLPTDFKQLISVGVYDGSDYHTVRPLALTAYSWAASQEQWTLYEARYLLREEFGTGVHELYIFPANIDRTKISYLYIAHAPVLSLAEEQFHGSYDELEYVETFAAIKLASKEESDTTELSTRKGQIWSKINNSTKDADIGAPRRVRNVRRSGYLDFGR